MISINVKNVRLRRAAIGAFGMLFVVYEAEYDTNQPAGDQPFHYLDSLISLEGILKKFLIYSKSLGNP